LIIGYVYDYDHPIRDGKSLRAIRTIVVSPFSEDDSKVIYFGGYDVAGRFNHNAAWIYKGTFVENQ